MEPAISHDFTGRLTRFKNKTLIKFIRTKEDSIFRVCDIYAMKLLIRLRLNVTHFK